MLTHYLIQLMDPGETWEAWLASDSIHAACLHSLSLLPPLHHVPDTPLQFSDLIRLVFHDDSHRFDGVLSQCSTFTTCILRECFLKVVDHFFHCGLVRTHLYKLEGKDDKQDFFQVFQGSRIGKTEDNLTSADPLSYRTNGSRGGLEI